MICARVSSDREAGAAGWLHHLGNGAPDNGRLSALQSAHHADELPRADAISVDAVYRALLGLLALSDAHYAQLLQRGLSKAAIKRHSYKTLPRDGRPGLVQQLVAMVRAGDLPPLAGVPGFYMAEDARPYPNLSGPVGMVIPVKVDGLIVGLQVRCDSATGGKYRWVSSAGKKYGTSSGAPVHVARGGDGGTVWITEGPLKANIAADILKVTVLGVAGVSSWRGAVELAKDLGATEVVVAYDMDKVTNPMVKHHSLKLGKALHDAGLKGMEAHWPLELKGLDDFLTNELYVQHKAKLIFSTLIPHTKQKYTEKHNLLLKHYAFLAGKAWVAWRWQLVNRFHDFLPLDCLKRGIPSECIDGHHWVFEPLLCGDRHHCVIDGHHYTHDQATVAMDTFGRIADKVEGLQLLRLVFTLPQELWDKVRWKDFTKFCGLANATMAEYLGGKPAGVIATQYWHTHNPFGVKPWYPHLHTAWLNLVLKDGCFELVSPFLDEARLKAIFARRLSETYKMQHREVEIEGKVRHEIKTKKGWRRVNLGLAGYTPINDELYVYKRGKRRGRVAKFSNKAYLKARLRYDFRLPQRDFADYADSQGWETFTPQQSMFIEFCLGKSQDYELVLTSGGQKRLRPKSHYGLPPNFRRQRWVGWLADGVRSRYCKELGVEVPTAAARRKASKDEAQAKVLECPIHHCATVRRVAEDGFSWKRISFRELEPGDVMLSPRFSDDGRYWVVTYEHLRRWRGPPD